MEMSTSFSPNLPARSTRGASKQRRDQINVEIQKLRDLLPLNGSIKDRLFQLQVMSLACIFIRKQRYFQHVVQTCEKPLYSVYQRHIPLPRQFDPCKALRGFLLMATRSGKLLYISENASEYLGYSVEEIMCQGDSIFDLVDSRDHSAVSAELSSGPPSISTGIYPDERVFICRMNLSRTAKRHIQYYKFILVEGRYLHPLEYYQNLNSLPTSTAPFQPIFAAFCRPLINPENAETLAQGNTSIFKSIHSMDLKFLHLDEIGCHHLGLSSNEIEKTSFYSILHPQNVQQMSIKHGLLCQQKEGSTIALIKLQTKTGDFIWLHSVFIVKSNFIQQQNQQNPEIIIAKRIRHLIYATHQVLSNLEAATLSANEWIYSLKQHHFSRELSKDDFCVDDSSISPVSSESDFNIGEIHYINSIPNQISVEIPTKTKIISLTPENSNSPDSNSSLSTTSAATKSLCYDSLTNFYSTENFNMPLPELGDDLDEFFRQVEYSTTENTKRGIKREWWETNHKQQNNFEENFQNFQRQTSNHHQQQQQRHHSFQFDHSTTNDFCKFQNCGIDQFNEQIHSRPQKRLGSWAGLESA